MFRTYTKDDAPAESMPQIKRSQKDYGFVPKLHGILAQAPASYQACLDTKELFEKNTLFSPLEQQIVFMVANYENNCHYCMPAHTFVMKSHRMPEDVIEDLREGRPLKDSKLEALRTYTKLLIDGRGHLTNAEIQEFFSAGYTSRHALEVLVGLAAKLLSNYANALAKTEMDEVLLPYAWVHPAHR